MPSGAARMPRPRIRARTSTRCGQRPLVAAAGRGRRPVCGSGGPLRPGGSQGRRGNGGRSAAIARAGPVQGRSGGRSNHALDDQPAAGAERPAARDRAGTGYTLGPSLRSESVSVFPSGPPAKSDFPARIDPPVWGDFAGRFVGRRRRPAGRKAPGRPAKPAIDHPEIRPAGNPGRQAGHLPRHGPQHGHDARRQRRDPRPGSPRHAAAGHARRRPRAARRGELVWSLGTIKPGEESSVEMQLMPTAEGEIGSVATVHFDADASARSIATRPQLVVETTGPNRVLLIGDRVNLTITVSNPGSGVATGVVLEEHIPAGLAASGRQRPGIRRGRPEAGRKPQAGIAADGQCGRARSPTCSPPAATATCVPSTASTWKCSPRSWTSPWPGPKRRYLEREATYQVVGLQSGHGPGQAGRAGRLFAGGPEVRQRQQRRPLRRGRRGPSTGGWKNCPPTKPAPWSW